MKRHAIAISTAALLLAAPFGTPAGRGESVPAETVRVSDWGFAPDDSTLALQAALSSGALTVIVDRAAGPWVTGPLFITNRVAVVFESGVEVRAKRGAFRGKGDCLLSAWNLDGLSLSGRDAVLRMWRDDYAGSGYEKAEWRHALSLRGCRNVVVEGLTLAESGGDGLYVGVGRGGEPCRDVVIRRVRCVRNYRQGISVISAENLLIEDCELSETAGTAPAAGIDFEPNRATERLVNCVMRRCVMADNAGRALHVYAGPLDGTSAPVSIRVEDCEMRGTNRCPASVYTGTGGANGPVRGSIEFVRCRFKDAGRSGVEIGAKPADGVRVLFRDCAFDDPPGSDASVPVVKFASRPGERTAAGGVSFDRFVVRLSSPRPLFAHDDPPGVGLSDVAGTLIVERNGRAETNQVAGAFLERFVPRDPANEYMLASVNAFRYRAEPSAAVRAAAPKPPRHRARGRSCYLVWAGAGDDLALAVRHQVVGRSDAKPAPVRVSDPAGRTLLSSALAAGASTTLVCRALVEGVHRLEVDPGNHSIQLLSSPAPVALAADGEPFHLIGTTGDFRFHVPPGTPGFGVRIGGGGGVEHVGAAILDPSGRERWTRPDLGPPDAFVADGPDAAAGWWTLRLSQPATGTLEDVYIQLRGLPPLLAFPGVRGLEATGRR